MSDKALVSVLGALADDELVIGHRHSEWTGFAPHMEEDVAFSSIAQDEIGHAAALYSLIARLTGDDADRLALGRRAEDYRHAAICERPNRDWAHTLARHWLYDHADSLRLESLESSDNHELASLATKMRREERYHLIHADMWMTRVAGGPVDGRTRLARAITELLGPARGLFEPFELEEEALEDGLLSVPSPSLEERFFDQVREWLDDLGLPGGGAPDTGAELIASSSGDLFERLPESRAPGLDRAGLGGRYGRHSADFDELWDDMTITYRSNPEATW